MNKRGVSPLIATVLLIGFAVALGAVIMNWGKGQMNTTCVKSFIDFDLLNEVPQICTNGEKLNFFITNQGKVNVSKLKITMIGGAGESNIESVIKLGIADTKKVSLIVPSDIGFLDMVKVIPILKNKKEFEYCTKKDIKVVNIPECK